MKAAWIHPKADIRTYPVGELLPNPFGLYDIHGNNYEWVQDWWSAAYYEQFASVPAVDPLGPVTGATERVIRGGAWLDPSTHCRSACRSSSVPNRILNRIGFRPALSVEAVQAAVGSPRVEVPVPAPRETPALAPGDSVELLKLIDVDRDAVKGKWTLTGEGLASDGSVPFCRLKLPYTPPREYDFRVEFTAAGGNDILQLLSAGGHDFTWLMGAWGGRHDGFDVVRGHPLTREGTNIIGGPSSIQRGVRHTSVIEVRKDSIAGYIDGKLVVRHATDGSDLSTPPEWSIDRVAIGLGTTFDAVVFHKVEVVPYNSGTGVSALPLSIAPFNQPTAEAHQQAWAKHLGVEVKTTNSIGMKFVLIPPGEFLMGSPESEAHRKDNETQHRVTLTKPFYLGRFEVTQAQYEKVMGANPSRFAGEANRPVEMVTWDDAAEFCRRLSVNEGQEYRLPTEAEWEYACRAGTTTPYHFGSSSNGSESNVNGAFPCGTTKIGTALEATSTIGNYPANNFGLYDMHGNVREFCEGWYSDFRSEPAVDPCGPADGHSRVIRGGAWLDWAKNTRAAVRVTITPTYRDNLLGFRVATTPVLATSKPTPTDTSSRPASVPPPAIDNTGSRPLPLSNAIDVEYRSPWHGRLEGKARQSSHSPVKIYALPLSRERSLADMEKMLRESRELTLRPGERCAAEFDLSTEPMIRGGMRYQLWVEVGGRRSPSMIVDLPGDDLEFELVEKLAELEDDGPFRVVVNTVPESHGMPPVQPTDDAAAVEAALAAWLDNRANESSEREIILLANANIPHDLNFGDQRYHFVSAEPIRQDAEKPRVFALRDSKALFRGRALRVEAVETGRQTATVELREESSELHGALAIVRLHRDQGAWRSSGEIMLQQYLLNC